MEHKTQTYFGRIHYRDAAGHDYFARAAVLCADRAGFDERLSAYFEARAEAFLWSEDVFEAVEWLKKFGHNGTVIALARQVSEAKPLAISKGKAEASANGKDEQYLNIEELENIEPLDMQFGVMDKLTVPAALQEAMFGQAEPTEAEREQYGEQVPPVATYAILDAAKLPYVLTANLEISGLEYQSLFQGEAQEDLGDYAPYIVRLEDGNDFTRKLFTTEKAMGLYEKKLGIFIRSRATLTELRRHFRKFTKVQDANGKWYYFRFWESGLLMDYFQRTQKQPDKVACFFMLSSRDLHYISLGKSNATKVCSLYRLHEAPNKLVLSPEIHYLISLPILQKFRDVLVKHVTNRAQSKGFDFSEEKIEQKATTVVRFVYDTTGGRSVDIRQYSKLTLMFLLINDASAEAAILAGEVLNNCELDMGTRIEITTKSYLTALKRINGMKVV